MGRILMFTTILCGALVTCRAAEAQTVSWGINGAGGSGDWNTSTSNWFNGVSNVTWPTNGNAVFAGASGGAVNSFTFGPVVKSMTFNTPGYVIQNGWIESSATGLTVTTNAPAKITSTMSSSGALDRVLIKNGPASLTLDSTLNALQINEGELIIPSGNLSNDDITLANFPGATLTIGTTLPSSPVYFRSLNGGGALGGIVQPISQSGTITLQPSFGGLFGGVLQDNGAGRLAIDLSYPSGPPAALTLTGANTYTGQTRISTGFLSLSGNGSIASSPVSLRSTGKLTLNNSGITAANRIPDTASFSMNGGALEFVGNELLPIQENAGVLNLTGASRIIATQPSAAPAQITFSGIQRNGHATLIATGNAASIAGLGNGSTGIVAPFISAEKNWITVGNDGRLAPWTDYSSDLNIGATTDHVKMIGGGMTLLSAATQRASLNLQNSDPAVMQSIDLSAHVLNLTSGGILSNGDGATRIINGTLSTPAAEFVITNNNDLSISATIIDGGVATNLTKSGTGSLTLTGSNSHSGATAINQGTLIVASDANLGQGATVEMADATLKAAGSFSSFKSLASVADTRGTIDTAGFNLSFSGGSNLSLAKVGAGTLTLGNVTGGLLSVTQGKLAVNAAATIGAFVGANSTLQVAGTLNTLEMIPSIFGPSDAMATLDIGGSGAASLSTRTARLGLGSGKIQIVYDIGATSRDSWDILFPLNIGVPAGAFQFEFHSLGGLKTGVDYSLISYFSSRAPSASLFAISPESVAAGWAGTFTTTPTGLSVRFTSVPEPSATALILLQGAAILLLARRRLRNAAENHRSLRFGL